MYIWVICSILVLCLNRNIWQCTRRQTPKPPHSHESCSLARYCGSDYCFIVHNTDKVSSYLSFVGFLSGLSTATLPEMFQRGMAPRIRPHVQSKYCSLDPYSPLTLVVPDGLSPPWKDCFVEGQKDILHGGTLSKALVQNARLKQCSR